ncbi:DUF4468 domain-containing protein [Bacteroidia bacterium]|nr:DUF4468 domain-containing protein [Bacteroidia bacterium]MDB9882021.1 DUF4468 domain-containing protein [Bacteroidia bacterium]
MKNIFLTLITLCLAIGVSVAQGWDDAGSDDSWGDSGSDDSWGDGSSGDDGSYDYDPGSGATATNAADSAGGDDAWGDNSWGDDGGGFGYGGGGGGSDYVRSTRPKVESKPYERFTGMPYDSASQLVTYVEIVEVIVPDRFLDLGGEDYSLSDSLYARAITWMNKQFGKKEAKQMIDEAGLDPTGKEGNTIKAYVTMPLVVQLNKYQKSNIGLIEFDMELRFKDERYRYKFENFIHVAPNNVGGKKEEVTYMEYYMTAKKNIRGNDQVLMACNNQMTRLIDDLKATCSATPFVDDDDW